MAKHLRKFIEELEAKGTSEIVARAQATIAAVEAGNAAGFLHSGAVCKNTIAAVEAGNAAGVGLAEQRAYTQSSLSWCTEKRKKAQAINSV